MRKCLPGLLAVLLALTLGCPGDPDTDYRAAIKKDLKEQLKFECPDGTHRKRVCLHDDCNWECKPDEAK